MAKPISIDVFRLMAPSDVEALSVHEMHEVETALDARANDLKILKTKLDNAKQVRYEAYCKERLREQRKDSGTVNYLQEDFNIKMTVAKKVDWDQPKLRSVVDELLAASMPVNEFVTYEVKVSERNYEMMPREMRNAFKQARTTKTGKPSIIIEPRKVKNGN